MTIINSNLDPDSKVGENSVEASYTVLDSGKKVAKLFWGDEDLLNIRRDFKFYKDKEGYGKVCAVRKRLGAPATFCKAVIDFSSIEDLQDVKEKTYCRLDIYLGVEGASPFIYGIQSPNEVLKGMPFWIEFTVKPGDSAEDIAKRVNKAIKSNHIFQCDKDLLEVTLDGSKLVLEGATEYQRFKKVEISQFSMDADYADVIATLEDDEAIKLEERGTNSFGTYSQIVKDLVLPTAANYQPYHIRQVETPILGATYNQYIVEYVGPSVNDGLHFVGQRGETHTMHVFWVKNDEALISEWEEALAAIGGVTEDVDAFFAEKSGVSEEPSEEPVEP